MKKFLSRWKLVPVLITPFLFFALFISPNIKFANAQISTQPVTVTLPTGSGSTLTPPTAPTPTQPSGNTPTPILANSTASKFSSVNFFSCTANLATCSVYIIGLVVQWIATLFFELGAFLIGVVLRFNVHIFDSPYIQTGFSVSLAIANLGFVLGIIIIALATILRNQTYGIKQLLWKLVAMAILVNFGLVITAPVVNFADSMSQYFITAVGGDQGYDGLATNLSNAFQPQQATYPTDLGFNSQQDYQATLQICEKKYGTIDDCIKLMEAAQSAPDAVKQAAGLSPADSYTQKVLGVIGAVILTSLSAIVLLCLVVLLLVRYVVLGILLVLLPLAWLTWVFPKFNSQFSRWWSEFIRWTFFPPLMLFFIYLAFITATTANQSGQTYLATTVRPFQNASYGVDVAIGISTGNFGLVTQILNEILLVALMMGGVFAASSLSGKAGGMVVSGAKSAVGWAAGYAGKQTKKGARLAFQKAGGEGITQHLREGRTGAALRKIPVVGGAIGGMVSRVEGVTGRAIAGVSTNEALVEAEKRNLSKDPNTLKSELKASMRAEEQFARLDALKQMGKLSKDDIINGQTVGEFFDKNPDLVARFGQKKLNEDADIVMGGDKGTRAAAAEEDKARAELDRVTKGGGDVADAMEKLKDATKKLDAATQEYLNKLQKSDMPKMNVNDIFGKNTSFSRALARNLALWAPQNVAGLMPKMKSPTLDTFEPMYRKELQNELKKQPHGDKILEIMGKLDLHPNAKNKQIAELSPTDVEKRLKVALESFERIISNNVTHSEREFPSAGGAGGGGGAAGGGGAGGGGGKT